MLLEKTRRTECKHITKPSDVSSRTRSISCTLKRSLMYRSFTTDFFEGRHFDKSSNDPFECFVENIVMTLNRKKSLENLLQM